MSNTVWGFVLINNQHSVVYCIFNHAFLAQCVESQTHVMLELKLMPANGSNYTKPIPTQ